MCTGKEGCILKLYHSTNLNISAVNFISDSFVGHTINIILTVTHYGL